MLINGNVDGLRKQSYVSSIAVCCMIVVFTILYSRMAFPYYYVLPSYFFIVVIFSLATIFSAKRHINGVQIILNGENMKLANYGITLNYTRPNCVKPYCLLVTSGSYQPVYVQQGYPPLNPSPSFPPATAPNVIYTQHPSYV